MSEIIVSLFKFNPVMLWFLVSHYVLVSMWSGFQQMSFLKEAVWGSKEAFKAFFIGFLFAPFLLTKQMVKREKVKQNLYKIIAFLPVVATLFAAIFVARKVSLKICDFAEVVSYRIDKLEKDFCKSASNFFTS